MPPVARFIVPALLLPALLAAAPFDGPAYAAATLSFEAAGDTGRFGFSGVDGVPGTTDVQALLTLTLLSRTASSFVFGYTIANDTAGSFDRGTLTTFGFDIAQDLRSANAAGSFTRTGKGQVPGFGPTDLCVMAAGPAGVCNGKFNSGVKLGAADGTGTLTLWLAAPSDSIDLSHGFVRWASVRSRPAGVNLDDGVSTGFVLPEPAPEPASWALMLAGFGLVGMGLRGARATVSATEARTPAS
jgi:hypothetical protein